MKAIEEPNDSNVHVKLSDLMKKNRISNRQLIRPLAISIKPENESQFRLYDQPNGNWFDFIVNGKIFKTCRLFF